MKKTEIVKNIITVLNWGRRTRSTRIRLLML